MIERLEQLRKDIASHAVEIEDLFNKRPMITIMVRQPTVPDGSQDVLVTSETDLDVLIEAIRTIEKRPKITAGNQDGHL